MTDFLLPDFGGLERDNSMENLNFYEPPKGGRVSSPKFRGLAQISEDFEGLPKGVTRFNLLHLVKDVGPSVGFTPRMIELLEYYLLFTRDCDWQEGGQPIVYQSQIRTAKHFQVSERQIQRLERALFEVGALTFDTVGNHKRFGMRAESGEILYASGVDLAPLAAMREVLEKKREEKRLSDEVWFETKRQISWYRSRIRSLIAEASEQPGLVRAAAEAQHAYEGINDHIRNYMDLAYLRDLLKAHVDVHNSLSEAIEAHVPASADCGLISELTQNTSSTDDINVAHSYSTNKNQFLKRNTSSSPMDRNASEGSVAVSSGAKSEHSAGGEGYKEEWMAAIKEEMGRISWKQVLACCSDRFRDHLPMTPGRPLGWHDVANAAHDLLKTLGISRSAYLEACAVLGRDGAALAVMITDRKTLDGLVRNPGGYLRGMTARAKEGNLNLHRSIFGLLKKPDGEKYDA